MNKFAKTLCMMAVVVLAFTSCKKDNQDVKSIPFNGSFEKFQVEESDYRAYMENDRVVLEDNDQLMYFNICADAAQSQYATYVKNGNQMDWVSGSINFTTTGDYYVFYPAANVNATNLTEANKAVFTLDPVQTYREVGGVPTIPNNALYMAAKDATHDNLAEARFDMKNICGVLELRLFTASDKAVRRIRVTDNAFNLVGEMTLQIDKVDPVEMTTLFYNWGDSAYESELAAYMTEVGYYSENTNPTVTLECGTDGVALSTDVNNPTKFYIVLRPLALLHGCELEIEFTDGSVETYESTKTNVVKPNFIRVIKAFQVG